MKGLKIKAEGLLEIWINILVEIEKIQSIVKKPAPSVKSPSNLAL